MWRRKQARSGSKCVSKSNHKLVEVVSRFCFSTPFANLAGHPLRHRSSFPPFERGYQGSMVRMRTCVARLSFPHDHERSGRRGAFLWILSTTSSSAHTSEGPRSIPINLPDGKAVWGVACRGKRRTELLVHVGKCCLADGHRRSASCWSSCGLRPSP